MVGETTGKEKRRRSLRSVGQTPTTVHSKESPHVTSGNFQSPDSTKKRPTMPSAVSYTRQVSKSKKYGCSHQDSKAQRRPKFGWPESTEKRPKPNRSGLFTASSEIGTSVGGRSTLAGSKSFKSPFVLFWQFCLFALFAASLKDITIASHNLHSFKQSGAYHKSCIENNGGIWFAQELWLSEKQLPLMQQLGTQFVARSGMEKAVSDGILKGRPFGGVSICWVPDINHLVTPLTNFRHKDKLSNFHFF